MGLREEIEMEEKKLFEQLGRICYEMFVTSGSSAVELLEKIKELEEKKNQIPEVPAETKVEPEIEVEAEAEVIPEIKAEAEAEVIPEIKAEVKPEETTKAAPGRIKCLNCGGMVIPGAKFCTICGTRIEKKEVQHKEARLENQDEKTVMLGRRQMEKQVHRLCSKCGARLEYDQKFCIQCGTPVR